MPEELGGDDPRVSTLVAELSRMLRDDIAILFDPSKQNRFDDDDIPVC